MICYYSLPVALLYCTFQYNFADEHEIPNLFEADLLPKRKGEWFDDMFDYLHWIQLFVCLAPCLIWILTHVAYSIQLKEHQADYDISYNMRKNRFMAEMSTIDKTSHYEPLLPKTPSKYNLTVVDESKFKLNRKESF